MKHKSIYLIIVFFNILHITNAVIAQDIEARISVLPAKVTVFGKILKKKSVNQTNNWSFTDSYADAGNLASRISNFALTDENNKPVNIKKFNQGEYVASDLADKFQYDVNLELPEKLTSTAHISWVTESVGLLMTADLFPDLKSVQTQKISAKITFDLPKGWKIISNDKRLSEVSFLVDDLEKSVFMVGVGWREKRAWIGKNELNIAIYGEWNFTDDDVTLIASQILQQHQRTFGEPATVRSQIFLLPFVKGNFVDNWRAETRGSTVTIISGMMPFKDQSLQRLHEQLRHELFHFWLPNNLVLSGNYDWFYEGFSIYQALRTGIELNYIRFEDFLYTISKTNEIANAFERNQLTLIDVSNNRWRGSTSLLYNKGFMVAFLCDLAIIKASKGKRNISDIFKVVWKKHKTGKQTEEGNKAILNLLKNYQELDEIVANYVEGKSSIDIKNVIEPFGLTLNQTKFGPELNVSTVLTEKQQDLLNKLGYNQWRKLLQSK